MDKVPRSSGRATLFAYSGSFSGKSAFNHNTSVTDRQQTYDRADRHNLFARTRSLVNGQPAKYLQRVAARVCEGVGRGAVSTSPRHRSLEHSARQRHHAEQTSLRRQACRLWTGA